MVAEAQAIHPDGSLAATDQMKAEGSHILDEGFRQYGINPGSY
jgi:hypothetical protein